MASRLRLTATKRMERPLSGMKKKDVPFFLVPAEDFEDFFLDRGHFFFAEQRIDHAIYLPALHAAQHEIFLVPFQPRFLETKTLAAHEQQRAHVTKVDASGIGLAFEPLEAIK